MFRSWKAVTAPTRTAPCNNRSVWTAAQATSLPYPFSHIPQLMLDCRAVTATVWIAPSIQLIRRPGSSQCAVCCLNPESAARPRTDVGLESCHLHCGPTSRPSHPQGSQQMHSLWFGTCITSLAPGHHRVAPTAPQCKGPCSCCQLRLQHKSSELVPVSQLFSQWASAAAPKFAACGTTRFSMCPLGKAIFTCNIVESRNCTLFTKIYRTVRDRLIGVQQRQATKDHKRCIFCNSDRRIR